MCIRDRIDEALYSGVTTMLGGGTGPATGTNATTCTPGAWHIGRMLQAAEAFPMNLGFAGKGNASHPAELEAQIAAGACAMKMHEDWGTTPAVIDSCLSVCDALDVQAMIHTDTLNESGFVENTVAAFKGRTIHAFHTEGAGGGHAGGGGEGGGGEGGWDGGGSSGGVKGGGGSGGTDGGKGGGRGGRGMIGG